MSYDQKTEEELENIAISIAIQAVMLTKTLASELNSAIRKISNMDLDAYVITNTWWEIALFGVFILQRKSPDLKLQKNRELINPLLKKQLLFSATNFGYTFKEEKTREQFEKSLATENFYEQHMKAYSDFRGDVSDLLKIRLWYFFNTNNEDMRARKIVFIEDDILAGLEKMAIERSKSRLPWKRLPLEKIRELTAEVFRKKGVEFILPESSLTEIVKSIDETFEEAELVPKV